jgi:quercetin dioxygenase-like cupin family protein
MTAAGTQVAQWAGPDLYSIGAGFVMADEGAWTPDPNGGFEMRSMGLEEASNGLLGAYHLRRTIGSGQAGQGDLDFHFLYVLSGSLEIAGADGPVTLGRGDAVHHGPGLRCTILGASGGTEAIEVTSPGRGVTSEPRTAAGNAPSCPTALISRDTPDQHVLGAGPRDNVIYRNLGTASATCGRYRMQVNRAAAPAERMLIWHYHDMAQWFVVLDGWARIDVENLGERVLAAGDALTVGAGPHMRHNVAEIGAGFQIMELCIPADYQTFPAEPPT